MVCLNNLARKYLCFGVVVLIMAAIFYFLNSNVASIFAEEENYPKTYQQTAILVLEMSDNQIFLKKAAKLNKEFIQIQAKETEAFVGDIEFKVISEASSLIYAGVAPDPSLVHYDWLDQEGNLFGGAIKKDSAVFTVKIPYQTDVQSVNFIKKIGEGHFLSDQNLGSIDLSQLQYSNELVSDGFSGTGFSQAPSVLGSSLPAPGNLQVVDRGAVYIKWLWDEVPEADHYLFCSYKSNDCSGEDFCRAISNIYHRKEVLLPQTNYSVQVYACEEAIEGNNCPNASAASVCSSAMTDAKPVFPAAKIINNGDSADKIDLVLVGDGYTSDQMQLYYTHVDEFLNGAYGIFGNKIAKGFLDEEPFSQYQDLFNVWRIDVVSKDSGADHPSKDIHTRETAFDATYSRIIDVANEEVFLAAEAVFSQGGEYDAVLVLVNDGYGGAAGALAVYGAGYKEGSEAAMHELGHLIGYLTDEYSNYYEGWWPEEYLDENDKEWYIGPKDKDYSRLDHSPNITAYTSNELLAEYPYKWSYWLNEEGVEVDGEIVDIDCYEGAGYCTRGLFRPAPHCKMRDIDSDFCPVCREQTGMQ